MQDKRSIEYPAFVYRKNDVYIANCILLNLISMGKTEIEVINNLEKTVNILLSDFDVSIKPVYEEIKSVKVTI